MDARFWDERYASQDQLFSGSPNPVLVKEVAGLPPGRALDVGCGEGADAIWLAERGWRVDAVDLSDVALQRAAAAAAGAGHITWTRADIAAAPPEAGAFDLVSAQFFPLPRQPEHTALRGLLDAVAPGGVLLFVGHDIAELPDEMHGVRPADFYQPAEIAKLLDDDWTIEINETRPRTTPPPPGSHHTHDTVLLARRRR